MNLLPLYRAEL